MRVSSNDSSTGDGRLPRSIFLSISIESICAGGGIQISASHRRSVPSIYGVTKRLLPHLSLTPAYECAPAQNFEIVHRLNRGSVDSYGYDSDGPS